MNRTEKEYIALILLTILIFIPLFIRPEVIGYADTYYYLNYIFGKSDSMRVSLPIIQSFFSIFPASFLFIKMVMLCISLFSVLLFYKTCKLITDKAIYPAILLLLFTPFSKIFMTFETSLFGLPFIFLSLYFIVKYKMKPNKKIFDFDIIFSLYSLFFAVIFWRFTIYYLPVFLIMTGFNLFYVFSNILLIPFIPKLLLVARPNILILENHPFVGVKPMLLLFPAYLRKFNIVPVLLLSWLTLFNYKFIYLLVPIALINIAVLFNKECNPMLKFLSVFGFVALLLSTLMFSVTATPNTDIDNAITQAKHVQNDLNKEVSINWSFGYYAIWHGVDTNYYGTYKKREYKGFTVTVPNDKGLENCREIEKHKSVWIYDC